MPRLADLIASPARLLQRIDVAGGRATFLPVTRAALEGANFLDGRSAIGTGAAIEMALADAGAPPPRVAPDRYVFHVSFCGSTLLTRLLARPGKAFALREPHCLVDLADAKASGIACADLVALARASLAARWRADEAVVVKPSNWANNLLPELCAPAAAIRPLFVDIGARAFLRAVFRGNTDRLAFTLRALEHLAGAADAPLLAAAVAATPDPLGRGANLALLALHIQRRQFADAITAGGWGAAQQLRYEAIVGDPLAAAQAASAALDLGLTEAEIADNAARAMARNAKQDGAFSTAREAGVNDAVEAANGRHFDAALAWAARTLPGWAAGD